jgi:ComEC/Rec2-related protein
MQSVLLLAPVFNREEDSITSLSFALLVILLINPFAISSVSLQLSFGAMAGIVLFSSRLNGFLAGVFPKVSSGGLFRYVNGIIASSLSVMVFTVPVTACHFSSLQILSPLTNILVLWAVSFCFCGGFIAVLVGIVFLPAGKIIACAVAWPARYITGCAKLIASVPFSSLYFSFPSGTSLIIWICLVYVFVLLAYFGRAKNPIRLFLPLVLSAASLCCVLYSSHEVNASGKGIISVINVGQGQCISVFSGEDTLVIDCGSTGSLTNAGETAGEYLQSCGRYNVDCLVLTHLHEDHVNGVETFLEYIDTDRIIIPSLTPDEDGYLERILSAAEKKGVSVSIIDKDMELTFSSGMKADLFVPEFDSDKANEQCLFVITSLGDYDMIVSGDSGKDQELAFLDKHPVHDAELLIAGHHGSKYSSDEEFLSSIGCDTAVISTGYNTYGHPTFETLNILHSLGYDLYRTDMNGTVQIKVS